MKFENLRIKRKNKIKILNLSRFFQNSHEIYILRKRIFKYNKDNKSMWSFDSLKLVLRLIWCHGVLISNMKSFIYSEEEDYEENS